MENKAPVNNSQEPIRVLQMIASLFMGGSQAMVLNLYRSIDRTKVQFDFIVDHPEHMDLAEQVRELGAKIYFMPTFTGKNIFEVRKAWDSFFNEHREYKVLHSHSRSYASIYIPIAKKHGLKTIIHSHNTSNGKGIKNAIKNTLQFPLRYQADYLFACSKDAGKWLYGEKATGKGNFHVINNAIDTEKYSYNEEIREKYRNEFNLKEERVFLQVGEFRPQKNYEFTIDLFRDYVLTNPNSRLILVGDGVLKEKITSQAREYGLEKNVIFAGRRNDVNHLLSMADVFLMPSHFEGVSVAAIEAQCSGILTLLSDKVSADVNVSDNCRFLPLNKETWIKEMNSLNSERYSRKEDVAKAGFDIQQTSKWIQNFYEELYNE